MSALVFPTFAGLKIEQTREAIPNTLLPTSITRVETPFSWESYPRYRYRLDIEVLRSDSSLSARVQEWQKLVGFHTRVRGSLDTFLFTDDEDNAVTTHNFGVGDGTTAAFQLQRTLVASADLAAPASRKYWPVLGDGYEPVFDLNGSPTLVINGGDGLGVRTLVSTSRTNLALWSEQFDNAGWTKPANTSVTANATAAPDGNVTADKLIESTTTLSEHYADQAVAIANTLSMDLVVYAKAAERSWLFLSMVQRDAVTVVGAYFDVTNGVVGTTSGGITATIQSCGSGWFRCAIVGAVGSGASNPRPRVELASANGTVSYAGTVNSGLYVWGAECEQAATDGDYILTVGSTASRTDYSIATGLVTFALAPRIGALLQWTGSYYRRVRFESDSLPSTRIVQSMWSASVSLLSIK